MIKAEELLAHPVALLDALGTRQQRADARIRLADSAAEAECQRIIDEIVAMPAGTPVALKALGKSPPAMAAKKALREAGIVERGQSGLTPVWKRTGKAWEG